MMNKTQSLKNFVYLVGLHIYYIYISIFLIYMYVSASEVLSAVHSLYYIENMLLFLIFQILRLNNWRTKFYVWLQFIHSRNISYIKSRYFIIPHLYLYFTFKDESSFYISGQ